MVSVHRYIEEGQIKKFNSLKTCVDTFPEHGPMWESLQNFQVGEMAQQVSAISGAHMADRVRELTHESCPLTSTHAPTACVPRPHNTDGITIKKKDSDPKEPLSLGASGWEGRRPRSCRMGSLPGAQDSAWK